MKFNLFVLLGSSCALAIAGCATTGTQVGGGGNQVVAGKTNGAQLNQCASPIGTAALVESDNPHYSTYGLTSPVPLIRLMMQESGCFQVVDRGAASAALQRERSMAANGDLQAGSNLGGGQMLAADYIITPSIIYSDNNAGGTSARLGGLLGNSFGLGKLGTKKKEVQTLLTVTNVRTGVQEVIAQGQAKKSDLSLGGNLWRGWGRASGGLSSYESTDIGKLVTASFLDSHNNVVKKLK